MLILAARSFNSKLHNNVSIALNGDVLFIQLQGGKGLLFCFKSIRCRSFWVPMQRMVWAALWLSKLCVLCIKKAEVGRA